MSTGGVVLVALAIAIGLIGVVVPMLPGSALVFAAIAVWAAVERTATSWVTLGVAAALLGAGVVVKYLWPVRRMRRAEVAMSSLVVGGLLGIVGFFVIPVLGLPIGFVGGIYLAELTHGRDQRSAWVATVHALKGVALSVGVELTAALLATVAWIIAVAF
ncbi:hypothetical protein A5707_22500 [Mycobacterium kyorinense]|uniref:DUF456 domain-containing protein n=1 Tax=Mycobacterium kyorinense TaxID=487514 RepID=A0A1A2Z5W7_9MYCO|nr:DUF456 domain-containing protein [Mycobacterium kyorinense]OBI45949.1 hypothetical protein A5707_22500 [Mycobacterium kyorinense]